MRGKIFLLISLILILGLSTSLVGKADIFTDVYEWIGERLSSSVVQIFHYVGGALNSVDDLINGRKIYFSCGDQLFAIQLIPAQGLLQDAQRNADANNDGRVSAEEWENFIESIYDQILDIYDTDRDGKIDAREARTMAMVRGEDAPVDVTYFTYGRNGELLYSYTYERDENGDFIFEGGGTNIEAGIVNGRRARITTFRNGRRDQIISWVPENPDDPQSEARLAVATYIYDENGNLIGAEGNLRALGIDYVEATVGRVDIDSAGRIRNVYDNEGNLIARNEYDSMGNNIRTEVVEGGNERIIERTFRGRVQTSQTVRVNGEVDEQQSWVLVSGSHGISLYRRSNFEAAEDIDNDRLTERFRREQRRYVMFNQPVFTTEDIVLMLDDPQPTPPRNPDPAATGIIGYDETLGQYYMMVEVWTNEEGVHWEEEPIKVYLDLSKADDETLQAIENGVGKKLTVYGEDIFKNGILKEGYTLQVIGLGKGPFEEHPEDLI